MVDAPTGCASTLHLPSSAQPDKVLPIPPIPEEVVRVAHAVFPRGNVFMQIRDTLGIIDTDEAFADLFPTHGQPAFSLAAGSGHHLSIYGRVNRPPGR